MRQRGDRSGSTKKDCRSHGLLRLFQRSLFAVASGPPDRDLRTEAQRGRAGGAAGSSERDGVRAQPMVTR